MYVQAVRPEAVTDRKGTTGRDAMTEKTAEEHYVLAIDQGTTSSRAIIFNHDGQIV